MSKEGETIKSATIKELNDEIFRVVGINNNTAQKYELLQKTHADWVAQLDKYRKQHAAEMNDCLAENLALREENIGLRKKLRAIQKAFDATFETELPRLPEVHDDPPTRFSMTLRD